MATVALLASTFAASPVRAEDAAAPNASPAERRLKLTTLHELPMDGGHVSCLAFSPNGKLLAIGGYGRFVIWDVETGARQRVVTDPDRPMLSAVAFSPDGKTIAATGSRKSIRLYATDTDELQRTLSATPQPKAPPANDAVKDRPIVDETGNSLSLPPEVAKQLRQAAGAVAADAADLAVENRIVMTAAFAPDGRTLATGSNDGEVQLWDVATGGLETTLEKHGTGPDTDDVWVVTYSPDGRRLASGAWDGTARIWDSATNKVVHRLRRGGSVVYGVVFSPDGSRLSTAGNDGVIREWDVESGKMLRELRGHGRAIIGMAISSDGKRVATVGSDETLRLWDVANGKAIGVLRYDPSTGPTNVACSPTDPTLLALGIRDAGIRIVRFEGSEAIVPDVPVPGKPFVLRQEIADDHVLIPPWQTFTAPFDGVITQVEVRPNVYPSAKGAFSIHAGEGVGGKVLHEQSYALQHQGGMRWQSFSVSPAVRVEKGKTYTWHVTGARGLMHAATNAYLGGHAGGTELDHCFRIHFEPPPADALAR